LGFDFKEGNLLVPTYYYLSSQKKIHLTAHKKKAESERSEHSLSKEDTPAQNKRAESEWSELSLNYERD